MVALTICVACAPTAPGAPEEASSEGGAGGDDSTSDVAEERSCESDCLSREMANWPLPHDASEPGRHPRQYVDEGALVRDAITRLSWLRAHFSRSTHEEAERACSELELEGHDDFRLPTRIELLSLVARETVPSIDLNHFPETPPDYFWSTSSVAGHPELAHSVYFGLGEAATGRKDQASAFVRCVRDGRRAKARHYDEGADFVRDLATGLVWERTAAEAKLTLSSAALHCAARTGPSGAPLRLPRALELLSLVDVRKTAPAIDPSFDGTPTSSFWSAPTSASGSAPLAIDFELGLATTTSPSDALLVRCVAGDLQP